MSFLKAEASVRIKDSQLVRLKDLIDWRALKSVLGKLGRSGYGPRGYDPIRLVKALILQSWHNLSDPGLEEALKVRLDFMVFTGFFDAVPDETTFCRFRNLLTAQGLWGKILRCVTDQLIAEGLSVEAALGAVIDATIIESAARPRRESKGIVVDREEDVAEVIVGEECSSVDPDAAWVKKGKKSSYGYKGFAVTGSKDGMIHHVHVTPANRSEVREMQEVVKDLKTERLYGDKGYASRDNRTFLETQGIKDGLMRKASRNKPLTRWEKKFNRLISKTRYIVEQAFGTLKRRFQFRRASYMTREKVEAQLQLKAISFNLLKGLRRAYCA